MTGPEDLTGTALEHTVEIRALDLRWEAKRWAADALQPMALPMSTGLQALTHHGGQGDKSAEQRKWWGRKSRWDAN